MRRFVQGWGPWILGLALSCGVLWNLHVLRQAHKKEAEEGVQAAKLRRFELLRELIPPGSLCAWYYADAQPMDGRREAWQMMLCGVLHPGVAVPCEDEKLRTYDYLLAPGRQGRSLARHLNAVAVDLDWEITYEDESVTVVRLHE